VRKVRIGERYKQIGGSRKIWEVADEIVDRVGIRHLLLVDTGDRTSTKLISERALGNQRLYEFVDGH